MLKFLATNEKIYKNSRTELRSRESSQKIAAGNCYSQFLIHISKSCLILGRRRKVIASGEERN